MAARSSRLAKVSRSAVIDLPPSEATRTFKLGVRERNWCGPVKSSWVTPSYTGITTLIGCDITCSPNEGMTVDNLGAALRLVYSLNGVFLISETKLGK